MAKKAPKVEKEDLMLPQSIDIKENYLLTEYPEALDLLLIDQTTHKNIFWASKSYEQLGDGYKFFDSITREKITGENGNVIKPRAAKSKEEQTMRVKVNAEVFTPSWICNKQNNLVDQSWFGRKDVFNKEDGTTWHPTEGKIRFPNKTGNFCRPAIDVSQREVHRYHHAEERTGSPWQTRCRGRALRTVTHQLEGQLQCSSGVSCAHP